MQLEACVQDAPRCLLLDTPPCYKRLHYATGAVMFEAAVPTLYMSSSSLLLMALMLSRGCTPVHVGQSRLGGRQAEMVQGCMRQSHHALDAAPDAAVFPSSLGATPQQR